MSRPPEKIAESCTEIVKLGPLLLLWIGKSAEEHFLDTMPIIGFLKTTFKRRLDVTNIILNNLQILIKSRLPK